MGKNYLTSIKHLFDSQQKLRPIPTNTKLDFARISNIKCVLFDIYGTLLISSSGDIDKLSLSPSFVLESFAQCGIKIISSCPAEVAAEITEEYKQTIDELKYGARKKNIENPEIDIRDVWEIIIQSLYYRNLIDTPWIDEVTTLAIYFETLSNKVYPMPFMQEIILWLHGKKIPMGIVSNAQFYTPVIMNYFLDNEVDDENENIKYFDPDLSIFSYQEKLSKPNVALYEKALTACEEKYKFTSDEILFVGNDMLKDIYPAKISGMRTALFAGDARSLRLRQDDPRISGIVPDRTIDSLEQIKEIIA